MGDHVDAGPMSGRQLGFRDPRVEFAIVDRALPSVELRNRFRRKRHPLDPVDLRRSVVQIGSGGEDARTGNFAPGDARAHRHHLARLEVSGGHTVVTPPAR